MMTRSNVALAAPLCAALFLFMGPGCASQQLLAIKDRDIRDLRQQNASRQEALVKALKTVEAVRAELEAAKYERRELEQEVARSSASIGLQQQTIDRLEAQKAKLQEQLRQSEIAYERLQHTYQDIKAVLSNTVTELAQTRREYVATTDGTGPTELAEHTRLRRKLDELRSQVIRERAARRAAEMDRAAPAAAPAGDPPPREDSSPWVWRLTEEPPEVETAEPGTLAIDERGEAKVAGQVPDEPDVLSTAFLWTLGAIPAIGLTLLMFIVLVRVLSRPGPDTRQAETSLIDEEEDGEGDEIGEMPVVDERDARGAVIEDEPSPEDEDEQSVRPRGQPRPADDEVKTERAESETQPIDAIPSSHSIDTEQSAAETAFIDSLAWLEETAQPPMRRRKHTQDTEAVQLPASSGTSESRDGPRPESHDQRGSGLLDEVPEPRKGRLEARETDDGNSDTQMIEKIEEDERGVTQVLPFLEVGEDGAPDADDLDGSRNQAFTETAVLDASDLGETGGQPPEESQGLDEVATDTQVLPPLLDFEDDSELDEALRVSVETDESVEQEVDDEDSELLAELEDLVGEKFEEPAF